MAHGSPVLFESNDRKIPPISRNFLINRGEILCKSDCMAERVEFEPTLPFCRHKPRGFRNMHALKKPQRKFSNFVLSSSLESAVS